MYIDIGVLVSVSWPLLCNCSRIKKLLLLAHNRKVQKLFNLSSGSQREHSRNVHTYMNIWTSSRLQVGTKLDTKSQLIYFTHGSLLATTKCQHSRQSRPFRPSPNKNAIKKNEGTFLLSHDNKISKKNSAKSSQTLRVCTLYICYNKTYYSAHWVSVGYLNDVCSQNHHAQCTNSQYVRPINRMHDHQTASISSHIRAFGHWSKNVSEKPSSDGICGLFCL